ncbi:uncharacterized protein C8R40DRAFT_762950 [Lentinula edodes]|uniref:uncharacterized protein n=1 Tax=Lentinula edodes TaxID=5353 RepID=UPI001E8E563A|nr:uncharacterized protein C8R40DRAFT_762950 [Lentinula edodes]KAH7878422.1 hypothetical protein C8R40DRAFT_762950 [Lentinula edodes]
MSTMPSLPVHNNRQFRSCWKPEARNHVEKKSCMLHCVSTVFYLPETRALKEAAQKFSEALVEEVLTIALPVLHPTSPDAYFEIDKVIGYPTRLADHEPFSVSFKKQGPHGPEYDLYQGWFFRTTVPVTGEIRTAGLKTLVARVENGNLVYPKVFHVPFELGIRTEASIRRNKILDSDTKIVL